MGTANSQYSEWIELYNDATTSVNLAGWKLYESSSTLIIALSKTIAAQGYLLVERTTASAPDAVPGVDDEAGSFGGGGLANTGEKLILKDANGSTVESLDFSSGWPAGDATTKQTMQWTGSDWITADPTPKAPTATSQGTTEDTVPTVEDSDPIPKVSPNKPYIAFEIPPVVYSGTAHEYNAHPVYEYNYQFDTGNMYWNMGDATMYRQSAIAPVVHTYQFPGTYTISYSFADPENRQLPLTGTKKITVVAPTLSLTTLNHKALVIQNNAPQPIDLTGWKLNTPDKVIAIPDQTIIAEGATIALPFSILSITSDTYFSITDPSGVLVATTKPGQVPVVTSRSSAPTTVLADESTLTPSAEITENPTTPSPEKAPTNKRTRTYILGALGIFVIALSLLLERFMARQE